MPGRCIEALQKGWLTGFGARLGSGISGFGRRVAWPIKAASYGLAAGAGVIGGWRASRSRTPGMPGSYRSRRDPFSSPSSTYRSL